MENKEVVKKTLEQKLFKAAIVFIVTCFSITIVLFIIVFIRDYGKADQQVFISEQQAIVITAKQLSKAYDDNEIDADLNYKGKLLKITGKIVSIGSFSSGGAYLVLDTGGLLTGVQCNFYTESEILKIAKLRKDSSVTVLGVCSGESFNIEIDNCSLK